MKFVMNCSVVPIYAPTNKAPQRRMKLIKQSK